MDVITPGFLIVAVIAVIVVGAVFGGRRLRAKPPSRIYRCRSCGSAAHHDSRTLDAWRRGKTAFFCQPCHRQWLRSQPPGQRDRGASATAGGSGCLGVIALVAALPLGLLLAWLQA